MAQLLIRNLDPSVKEKLRARAHAHRRSMEEEARVILRDVVAPANDGSADGELGWASRIAAGFKGIGLTEAEAAAMEIRDDNFRPAEFE